MKNVIKLMLLATITISAWEINTHRAIERKAIEASDNLKSFVKNTGFTSPTFYDFEQFEGYATTYIKYIEEGETNGISTSKWKQDFSSINLPSYQKMIEAGSILEDAQWPHSPYTLDVADRADGRFVNHFYDAQNGGHALNYGAFLRIDALHWAYNTKKEV